MASEDVSVRLDAFWSWWRTAAPRVASAVDDGQADSIAGELSVRVHAIDPRLAWETGPGLKRAHHHLALSPEGDIELRVLTERWLSRAPPADRNWEYYAARQPYQREELSLALRGGGSVTIDLASVRVAFEVDDARELIQVIFNHPGLAKLDDQQRGQAAFLVLDNLLGEDGVERWLGSIKTSVEPLPEGKTLEALADAVEALRKAVTGERFAIADWKTHDGQPMVATINLALKRIDHLLMDDHLVVTIPLQDPTPKGLTTEAEANVLNALEHELVIWLAS